MRTFLVSAAVAWLALTVTTATGCASPDDEESADEQEQAAKSKGKGKDKDKDKDKGKDDKKKDPPPPPPAHRFSVVQHNIGGGAENASTADALAYTFGQIDEKQPDVVMLEEMCFGQFEAFQARYKGWDVHFTPMLDAHAGCGNQAKGQVLASPRALGGYATHDLGDPDGPKKFTLSCGNVPMPRTDRSVLACVTHLRIYNDDDGAARTRQASRIAAALNGDIGNGKAVVFGGDLNSNPDKPFLNPVYRLTVDGQANGGKFDEADQTDPDRVRNAMRGVTCMADACRSGVSTTESGPKFDYVFFSHNRVAGLGAQAMGRGGSGHKLYHAWADLDL